MKLLRMMAVVTTALLATTNADAHPFHASATEIEWNADSQRFEVAMQLRIADLEDAISAKMKSRFRLETDPERKAYVQAYLQEKFSITFAEQRQCRLHWIGCELELHDVWVYFEAESIPASDAEPAVTIQNTGTQKISSWDGLFRASTSTAARTQQTVRIQNTVLLELQPEQVNLVSVKIGVDRATTSFHHQKRDAETLAVR